MQIDWRDKTPGPQGARPDVVPGVTMLETTELRLDDGTWAAITRTFRSWSTTRDGDFHVHAWAEDIDTGWVFEDGAWVQYDLGAHCAALPRHDERGVWTHANPNATIDGAPRGRNPKWGT